MVKRMALTYIQVTQKMLIERNIVLMLYASVERAWLKKFNRVSVGLNLNPRCSLHNHYHQHQ